MGELRQLPLKAPRDRWVPKKQLAAILDRSVRWVEMRLREGAPSEMRRGKRMFHVGAFMDWLEDREQEKHQNGGDPAPATPAEKRVAELELRVTKLERELSELKGNGEPDEPGDAA